jgi:hypothetical protein
MKAALLSCIALLALAPVALASAPTPAAPTADAHVQLARFGGGGFRGTSRGFGTRPRYGYGRRRGHSIFRSLIRGLVIGYLLHLLFTTPGGNILLLLMIAGIVMLFMRFRRRRTLLRY